MLGTEPRLLPVKAWSWSTLRYTSVAEYRRDLSRARRIAIGGVEGLANRLRVAGVLSRQQVALIKPRVTILVHDQRLEAAPQLPEISWVKLSRDGD